MRTPYRFGKISGFEIRVKRRTIPASGALWVIFSVVAHFFLDLDWVPAILWSLAAVVLHYLGEVWHQVGHAAAARRTGHPMEAVLFTGLLGRSVYPTGETGLPAAAHIRRALGGPVYSSYAASAFALILVLLQTSHRMLEVLLWFLALENLLVYCIGALLPLGFTDGSTILRHWRKP